MISGQVLRNRMAVLKEAEQYGAVLRVLRIVGNRAVVLQVAEGVVTSCIATIPQNLTILSPSSIIPIFLSYPQHFFDHPYFAQPTPQSSALPRSSQYCSASSPPIPQNLTIYGRSMIPAGGRALKTRKLLR